MTREEWIEAVYFRMGGYLFEALTMNSKDPAQRCLLISTTKARITADLEKFYTLAQPKENANGNPPAGNTPQKTTK